MCFRTNTQEWTFLDNDKLFILRAGGKKKFLLINVLLFFKSKLSKKNQHIRNLMQSYLQKQQEITMFTYFMFTNVLMFIYQQGNVYSYKEEKQS